MGKPSDTVRFRLAAALVTIAWLANVQTGAAQPVGPRMVDAAHRNVESLSQLPIAPFRRPEQGWEVYEPLIAHEIGAPSGADTPAFAAHLATWQSGHGLGGSGIVDVATITAMKTVWLARRPFVAASQSICPEPPPAANLATIPAGDAYGGKVMQLRPAALAAYERMLSAARADVPALRQDPRLLTIFSAFRAPAADAMRCARDGNCQGVTRASCSAHLTGLAVDLFLGSAPGLPPDSSDDANRLFISRGGAYLWMVSNARRFGFEPYPFEPWHWEWTGEPI
jgi:D-alanyl-D-alanine carboxypeptidase